MRAVVLAVLGSIALAQPLRADATRIDVGDPPRTFSHFLNAREAALCRASAATGGVEAYFLNPAAASRETSVAGEATVRLGTTRRSYLPQGENGLESSDGAVLFSQLVAVKRTGNWVFGFGYSCPSYRSLELTGLLETRNGAEPYDGTFEGGLRFFELVLATTLGRDGRAGVGIAGGVATMSESVREVLGQTLETADVSGSAASVAAGFVYDAAERVRIGVGYRWGASIDVRGEWYEEEERSGTSKTQPTAVAGVSVQAGTFLTAHAGFVHEGWGGAESTLSAYPEDGGRRNEFDEAVGSVALGVEGTLLGGRLTLRAGVSKEVLSDISVGSVPENAVGLGFAYSFDEYLVGTSLVREQFAVDGESGEIVTYGVHVTAGYRF